MEEKKKQPEDSARGRSGQPGGGLGRPSGPKRRESTAGLVRRARRQRLSLMAVAVALILILGLAGGYLAFKKGRTAGWFGQEGGVEPIQVELTTIRVYFPSGGKLSMEERRIIRSESQGRMAEETVREFLKGPGGTGSYVPEGTELLGIYPGSDGILYVDLADEFRSNFQGDAMAEFLLLRALYESIMTNVAEVKGIKVLIEGKEIGSIGGHISLPGTLGEAVSHIVLE